MPKPNTKKTKSARRVVGLGGRWRVLGMCIAAIALVIPFVLVHLIQPGHGLVIGSRQYSLAVASTEAAREKGLGGKDSMPRDHGMLFVLARPEVACFWMKDMRFSLDIIWLDEQKQVIHVAQHITPHTYPRSFCPPQQAKYVIELRAGEAERSGIRLGQKVSL